jgi:hypothetical protein
MPKKNEFPKKLIAVRIDHGDGDEFITVHETPEDIDEEHADSLVAIYELITVGKFTVEKQVDAKPPVDYWAGRNGKKPAK